jgi:hypothetical protein
MKRVRFQISSLLWLVAIAAAFFAGVRYGEYRAGPRPSYQVYKGKFALVSRRQTIQAKAQPAKTNPGGSGTKTTE